MFAISADTIRDYPLLRESGLSHRRTIEGDEKVLVDRFLAKNLTPAPDGQERLVFVEPRLETGFPDVVVVYLDKSAAKEWSFERGKLGKLEICILHHLATTGVQNHQGLTSLFDGFQGALKRLERLGLVTSSQEHSRAIAIRKLLAVRRLVAIEAKIGAWRAGLDQAFMNRWFASESYLLMPSVPNSAEMVLEMRATGVGLLTSETPLSKPTIQAAKSKLPGSYATWLFNEWACNARLTKASPTHGAKARHGPRPKRQQRCS